jgi:hypothetical protein
MAIAMSHKMLATLTASVLTTLTEPTVVVSFIGYLS